MSDNSNKLSNTTGLLKEKYPKKKKVVNDSDLKPVIPNKPRFSSLKRLLK